MRRAADSSRETEPSLLRSIQIAISRIGARVLRNNVGVGWTGGITRYTSEAIINVRPGDVVIRQARPLHAGLGVGSADLIGWAPVVVDESMLGRTLAVFLAVEVKAGRTKVTKEQEDFLAAVRAAGGIAVVARDENEATAAVSLLKGDA